MAASAPVRHVIEHYVPAAIAAAAQDQALGVVPFDGVVTSVQFVPDADVTGADTNYRTLKVVNKGANGNGTTAVATLALTDGVTASDFVAKALTLSATAADKVVTAGQVLAVVETVTGDGLASPGGLYRVVIDG